MTTIPFRPSKDGQFSDHLLILPPPGTIFIAGLGLVFFLNGYITLFVCSSLVGLLVLPYGHISLLTSKSFPGHHLGHTWWITIPFHCLASCLINSCRICMCVQFCNIVLSLSIPSNYTTLLYYQFQTALEHLHPGL